MRISDWSSDVCSSDLVVGQAERPDAIVGGNDDRQRQVIGSRRIGCLVTEIRSIPVCRIEWPHFAWIEYRAVRGFELVCRPARQTVAVRIRDRKAQSRERLHRQCGRTRNAGDDRIVRSEEHTSELQSLMRISYAVFCLKKKK